MTSSLLPPRGAWRAPSVPGVRLGALLGVGPRSAVWAGSVEGGLEDGAPVALKLLSPRAAATLGEEVDLLRSLHAPGLVPVRDVVASDAGPVLVLDRARTDLAALLAARGSLRAGEVVTLVAGVAAVLADLHARGLAHGAVHARNVLFDSAGNVLVADACLQPGTAAGDVSDLAALALQALGSATHAPRVSPRDAGAPLAAVLQVAAAAVSGHGLAAGGLPAEDLAAEDLARRCQDAGEAVPVHLPAPGPQQSVAAVVRTGWQGGQVAPTGLAPAARRGAGAGRGAGADVHRPPTRARPRGEHAVARGQTGRRSRPRRGGGARRAAVVVAAGALLAGASVLGGVLLRGERAAATPAAVAAATPAAPAAPAATAGTSPRESFAAVGVVQALARSRDRAVTQADPALLADVDVPGSPAETADRAALAALVTSHQRVSGRTSTVTSAVVVSHTGSLGVDGTQVWVRATVVTSAHDVTTLGPGAVTPVGRSSATSMLLLERTGGRWLVAASQADG